MPNVILESGRGINAVPIEDVLLRSRKIFLVGEVNDESCNTLIKELLYMESEDDTKPITLYINSPGGEVTSGLAVYDTIRLMKSPVTAVVTGIAASMGSIIFLACDSDKRLMLPSSKVMIHDCSWGRREMGGKKPFEIEQELNQLKGTNERLVSIIAERTGKTMEEIAEVTKYDSYFSAEKAIEFGLASGIVDAGTMSELLRKAV
ncbi:MAG: ATP-dependent Clp protease proteolytic subunit [Lachnospiraceae bacterium]|nr:ATP-dependent Clp protease proteolytic subunit [Lachnospiraceae bacterium]